MALEQLHSQGWGRRFRLPAAAATEVETSRRPPQFVQSVQPWILLLVARPLLLIRPAYRPIVAMLAGVFLRDRRQKAVGDGPVDVPERVLDLRPCRVREVELV